VRAIAPLLTAFAVASLTPAARAGFQTGRAEYDAATALYTYTYSLDNTAGPWPVTEVDVLVAPDRTAFDLRPVAWSAPPGWEFGTAVSGGIANPPYNEIGTFWFWYRADGLPVGERAEFTFASSYGSAGAGNNYFVFAPGAARDGRDGVIEFGRTVAPVVAPEPATAVLCGIALGLVAVVVGWNGRAAHIGWRSLDPRVGPFR
jgi:hypothetical protein